MWRNWSPRTLLVGMQNGAATLENSLAVPQVVTELPSDPAVQLLGTRTRETKTSVPAKTYTQTFIAALFIIVKIVGTTQLLSSG